MRFYYDKSKISKEKVMDLWQDIFKDPNSFAEYYFDKIYRENQILLVEQEQTLSAMDLNESESALMAMLHLNPYNMLINGKVYPVNYIVGVATAKEYRRQGIMKSMMEQVLEDMAADGQLFTFLMPAKECYYTPFQFAFGYDRFIYEWNGQKNLKAYEYQQEALELKNIDLLVHFCDAYWKEHFTVAPVRDRHYFKRLQEEVQTEDGQIQLLYDNQELIGFYTYSMNNGQVNIREVITTEPYDKMIDYLGCQWNQMEIMLDWFNHKEGSKKKPMIMFRILNLERLLSIIKSDQKQQTVIKVVDPILKQNENTFLWKSDPTGSQIEVTDESADAEFLISDLTGILFNYNHCKKDSKLSFFEHIVGLDKIFISEIV